MRPLVPADHPVLRQRAIELLASAQAVELLDELAAIRWENRALGIAAPQIGVPLRVAVVNARSRELRLVNPRIIRHSETKTYGSEACLSLPGVTVEVPRWLWVKVESIGGKTVQCHGLEARAVQHEIDHSDGKLITDYVSGVRAPGGGA